MFEELSERLEGVIRRLGGKVVLNEESIREGLQEIRKVMLEADVNYRLVQDFLKRVEEKALGREVIKSVSPGQMMVKIVHDELVELARKFGAAYMVHNGLIDSAYDLYSGQATDPRFVPVHEFPAEHSHRGYGRIYRIATQP